MLVLWAIENPLAYIQEHARVLRYGGRFVLSGAGPETRNSVPQQLAAIQTDFESRGLFPKMQEDWKTFLEYTSRNVAHIAEHWFTHKEITDLFTQSGLTVSEILPNPIYCDQGHVVVATKRD